MTTGRPASRPGSTARPAAGSAARPSAAGAARPARGARAAAPVQRGSGTPGRVDTSGDQHRGSVRLLPSAVTVLALCAGLSAIKFALDEQAGLAIAMIGAAAVLDALDGRIARLLDATSRMGAELDSLADAIGFGVAPALVVYVTLLEGSRAGWVVALVYAVCLVLRLARFNTLLGVEDRPAYTKEFFTGVPAPAAAILALTPLVLSLQLGRGWWTSTLLVSAWMVLVAGLAISRVPTLSLKAARVPPRAAAAGLVLVGVLAAGLITFPLVVLLVLTAAYLAHIPYAVARSRWITAHPGVWESSPAERRAIRKSMPRRRPSLRPRRRKGRVAGRGRGPGQAVRR